MPADSFLVNFIKPANEEKGVSVDTDIRIKFNSFMDEGTFTPNRIRLSALNPEMQPEDEDEPAVEGEPVSWRKVEYINKEKTLVIQPNAPLSTDTEYLLVIAGTHEGVRSLATNYYLPNDGHYHFTTEESEIPSEEDGDGSETPEEPKDPTDPEEPEEPEEPPFPTTPPVVETPGDIFSFGIRETYPVNGAVHITPEQVIALFDSPLDESSISSESVYIVRGKGKPRFSTLDMLTVYSPDKAVGGAVITVEDNTLIIDASLEDNAEYTVIIRGSVKSQDGNVLGQNMGWSFMTKFPYLYGDAELIRNDLSTFMSGISDRILYKMMRDNSEFAYEIATTAGTMPNTDAEGAPIHVHQYVRYKTAYDLLVNGQIRESSSSGSSISLGDLSVDKSGGSTEMAQVSKDFRGQIKMWEDAIRGYNNRGYARTRSVVKGENVSTYPEFLTRAEYRELGQ